MEAHLQGVEGVEVEASELEVILSWSVVGVREAGVYKCEITYLTSSPCPVVRLISRLVVISPPTSLDLFTSRPQVRVTNSTIGPFREGQQVRLRCVSGGESSAKYYLYWYLGDSPITGHTHHHPHSVSSSILLNITRSLLNKRVVCKVANLALDTRPMTASVEIDLNLEPVTTVITAELDREDLVSGDRIILLCQAEGARPAATISWYNTTQERTEEILTDHSQDQIASLQSDGTYVTLSRLIVDTKPWHHGNTLTCVSSQTSNHSYVMSLLYPPQVSCGWTRHMRVQQGSNVSIVCEYHGNPPGLVNIQVGDWQVVSDNLNWCYEGAAQLCRERGKC